MNRPSFKRTLKLSRTEHLQILSALADHGPDMPGGRHDYTMADIPMSVEQPQGGQSQYLVYGHWLARNGIGVLTGRYVHPGSTCLMVLARSSGERMLVRGKVTGCCLLSGSCHSVEVALHDEIDPGDVEGAAAGENGAAAPAPVRQQEKLEGAILVVEPFVPDLLLLEHHLSDLGPELRLATTPGATLDAVKRAPVDLVLSGLNIIGDEGVRTLERLRKLDCTAPILLLTAETDAVAIDRARRAGATDLVAKPYNVDLLVARLQVHLGGGQMPDRMYSTVGRDPALSELVTRYVKFVRRAADQVDRTHQECEWSELRELCCQLKGSGVGYGFQHVTVAAIVVLNAMERGVSTPGMKQAVQQLIDCCRAVQDGASESRAA